MQRVTGEMTRRVSEFDWSQTSIGPPDQWPVKWRDAWELTRDSSFPAALALGPELIYLYNDAFIPVGGPARHPSALGLSVSLVWQEIWQPYLEQRFKETLATGLPTGEVDLLMPLLRRGYLEETYMRFSFSPIRDDQGVPSGILCTATENTELVITKRQTDCLRSLVTHCATTDSPEEAARLAAAVLEEQERDFPFVLLYLFDQALSRFKIAAIAGLTFLPEVVPRIVPVDSAVDSWPLTAVGYRKESLLLEDVQRIIGPALSGSRLVPRQALALPVLSAGSEMPVGILVTGFNPMRPTEECHAFHAYLCTHLEKAFDGARMKQLAEERARELLALDRAKTLFFSNVSHQLRTPLTLLLDPVRQALEGTALAPEDRKLLEIAGQAGGRLLKLVNSLLEFSRIEAGRSDARFIPTNLAQLTSDLAGMFRSHFELARIRFLIDCPPTHEPAYVDPDMWEWIVLNLLSNALKFTSQGQVSVGLRQLEEHFMLEVTDTGCGIAQADVPRIFERFTPRPAARARSIDGVGIGLSLVQELAKLHGGTVEVASQLEQGTTVTVRIPRGFSHLPPERIDTPRALAKRTGAQPFLDEARGWLIEDEEPATPGQDTPKRAADRSLDPQPFPQATPAQTPPGTAERSEAGAKRILVVEDDPEMRRYLARLLSGRWQVKTAPDGAAALEQIRQSPPDLILADIMTPRMDGLQLLHALRADPSTEQIPVLLISARAGEEASVGGVKAGAEDYLVKPFSQRELIARIEARLAQAGQRAAERCAREQAQQNLRAREEFFAALAHELRSPIESLSMWSAALQSGTLARSQRIEALDAIEWAARTLRRLAEDFHDVAAAVSGHLHMKHRVVASLAPFVAVVIDAFALAAATKRITIRTCLGENCGPVRVDIERVQQVVSSLLSNAIRYTPEGGSVEVHCNRCETTVEIRVSDSGRGITAESLPHIFERYWRGKGERQDGGLGLGLAIVQRLLELQGGEIAASSDGRDRGATFVVRLPVVPLDFQGSPDPLPMQPPSRVQDTAQTTADAAARQRRTGPTRGT